MLLQRTILVLAISVLAGCGPSPQERAQREASNEAKLAKELTQSMDACLKPDSTTEQRVDCLNERQASMGKVERALSAEEIEQANRVSAKAFERGPVQLDPNTWMVSMHFEPGALRYRYVLKGEIPVTGQDVREALANMAPGQAEAAMRAMLQKSRCSPTARAGMKGVDQTMDMVYDYEDEDGRALFTIRFPRRSCGI